MTESGPDFGPSVSFWRRPGVIGAATGALYGLAARWIVTFDKVPVAAIVMTVGFLFITPIVIGYLTVRPMQSPSIWRKLFAPWGSCLLVVVGSVLVGFEGAVCVVFASPVMLLFSSVGGLVGGTREARSSVGLSAMLVLPLAIVGVERGRELPRRFVTTETSIDIGAPAGKIWPLVVSVDSIRAVERRPALFTSIGFPRPIAATLNHPGVGGMRTATFERGVVFREVVTDWDAGKRIRFTIDASMVPTRALDEHVTIGGPFFDVLNGTYELRPIDSLRTRLVLRSEHRVSTHFNPYASWWADRVMRSIQLNILEVLKDRAEKS